MIDLSVFDTANETLPDLRIETELVDTVKPVQVKIALIGVLSHTNTADFTDCIMSFFQNDWKNAVIILDLSKLQYISSSGIGSFTTIRMQVDLKDSTLYLLNMNSKVRQVFDQLGFTAFFTVIESQEEIP